MKIGMMGAGGMGRRMTETFRHMDGFTMYALASAFPEECVSFVDEMGWQKSYDSYLELVSDPEVDILYAPVPTNFHHELVMLAIEHGKPILCEKPLCFNEKQVREVVELARSRRVFLAEGLWTNYMPIRRLIEDVIKSEMIGTITEAEIVMRNNIIHERRFESMDLAAGALMDVGSYTVGSTMVGLLGSNAKLVDSAVRFLPNGLDESNEFYFEYENGPRVKIVNNVHSDVYEKYFWFKGTKGKLLVDGISNPKNVKIFDVDGCLIRDVSAPQQLTGYEYQWYACERAMREGALEPAELPHQEIIDIARVMDGLREQIGIRFPFE